MYRYLCVALLGCLLAGCAQEEDPRNRPGFVDTSDPSKVMETMKPLETGPGSANPGGASTSLGAGAPPNTGS